MVSPMMSSTAETRPAGRDNLLYNNIQMRFCHTYSKIQNNVMLLTQDTEQGNVTYPRYRIR